MNRTISIKCENMEIEHIMRLVKKIETVVFEYASDNNTTEPLVEIYE